MPKIQITPELIAEMIPLPEGVKVVKVGFDHTRQYVTAELEGEGLPNREIVTPVFSATKKECGSFHTDFLEWQ